MTVMQTPVRLEDVRDQGLLPDDLVAAYISGSRARGWGNAASNLNIYLVTEGQWQRPSTIPHPIALTPDTLSVEIVTVGEVRWDVEYWLDTQVDQMLAKVAWSEFESAPVAGGRLTSYEIDFLERLTYAVPLHDEEWLGRRREELSASAYAASLVARGLNFSDVAIEDAVGQLEADDIESAVLSARIALGFSVDALLASAGEFGGSPKWRARRFRSAQPAGFSFEDYWVLESMQGFRPDAAHEWIEQVVLFCRRIALTVEV